MAGYSHHEPCPACGSKDNLARYDDGHGYCFGCRHYDPGDGEMTVEEEIPEGFVAHRPCDLEVRGLREETLRLHGYGVGTWRDQAVQVADYRDGSGELVAQKVRTEGKEFVTLGAGRGLSCWQTHRWRGGSGKLLVSEGEIDLMCWAQLSGNRWPGVSVPSGAAGAAAAVARDIEFFESFDEVVLFFDADDPGREAARECAALLTPGKAKIAKVPGGAKDICEAVQKGLAEKVVDAFWQAKTWRPDGIVAGTELWEAIVSRQEVDSVSYQFDGLQRKLHGLRMGELVVIIAGTGTGKSTFCRSLAVHVIRQTKKVGYIALEEGVARTGLALLGQILGRPLHLERTEQDELDMRRAFEQELAGSLCVFNHFGSLDAQNLLNRVKYMRVAEGVDYVIIDHLTILVTSWSSTEAPDERRAIDQVVTALRSICEATGVGMVLVSHVRRPTGKSYEDGESLNLGAIRGSTQIACLSDAVIALEREQQADDPNTTTVRVLKNRYSGELGKCCEIRYDPSTGLHAEMVEVAGATEGVPF